MGPPTTFASSVVTQGLLAYLFRTELGTAASALRFSPDHNGVGKMAAESFFLGVMLAGAVTLVASLLLLVI